ncbi:hypothetical protein LSAT2_024582 [Lamellibrachia satsuma]|nr:hypothetical protein LSAT2_024582 [Lamellibrachia satsuma]
MLVIADIDENECREALLEFVTETACYGKAPAREMKITYIKPATALHYVLETFCEARSAKFVSEPYRGGWMDGPENGEPPRLWKVVCRHDQLFVDRQAQIEVPHTATIQTASRSGCEILEGMVEGERDRGKTKSHMDRQHQGVDGKYWREWWRVKETGEDQEAHGQTAPRSGWEILEGMVEGERDRGRPRATWTDSIKEWMGNIGGNGGG